MTNPTSPRGRAAGSQKDLNLRALSNRRFRRLADVLEEREHTVLTLRFRTGAFERSLEEVAEELGLTRERVRQIESRALSKLRHPKTKTGVVPRIRLKFWSSH